MRSAAAKLARSVQSMTVRLCDTTQTPAGQAAAATAAVLPLLLTQGLSSSVGSIQVSVLGLAQPP